MANAPRVEALIPRSRVNYTLVDVLKALMVRERSVHFRHKLARMFAKQFGTENILLTPSGRAGLFWLLRALPQQRVVVPAYTCSAIAQAVSLAGKEIVFVECRVDTFNIDLDDLRRVVSADSIVLATHQYGIPCNIVEIAQLSKEIGAFLIEDVAAALGTSLNRKMVGMFGDAAFFSFDGTKLINVPTKAGVLLVRSHRIFQQCKQVFLSETRRMNTAEHLLEKCKGVVLALLRHSALYGLFHMIWFRARGWVSAELVANGSPDRKHYFLSMPEWQAKIAVQQIERLDELVALREAAYWRYLNLLRNKVAGLPPPPSAHDVWACVRFPLLVDGDKIEFYRKAAAMGVDLGFSFTVLSAPKTFGVSHMIAGKVLNLPLYPDLSLAEQRRVVEVVVKIEAGDP